MRRLADRIIAPLQIREHRLVSVVTGNAPADVIEEVQRRLNLAFAAIPGPQPEIRIKRRLSAGAFLRSHAVVLADSSAVGPILRRITMHVFDLDFTRNPVDGWELAELMSRLSRSANPLRRAESRRVLAQRVQDIHRNGDRPIYLFGTGPSLERAIERIFSDGVTVVCNTIVKDPLLWEHLDPDILVAGDAIYHFGFTPHALAFRHDALARLSAPGSRTLFVYPEIFDAIVRHEFQSVAARLVPIPFGEHTDVTVDLCARFELPMLGNVLNLLLLPIGSTLGKDIRLWGFDGRGPSDVGFWANSGKQAYLDLIPTIRAAHPAFFNALVPQGRESQYVASVHGEALERRLSEAEANGFRFEMLHFSWTPTFAKRFHGTGPAES